MTKRIVAKITGYHGLKGEIKLEPLLDSFEDFAKLKQLYLHPSNNLEEEHVFDIQSQRVHKEKILIKLSGINSLTEAEKLQGYVSADLNEELADDEFYIDDLKGLSVHNVLDNNILVGKVQSISQEAQMKLIITLDKSYQERSTVDFYFKVEDGQTRRLILPFVEEYIEKVDIGSGQLLINLTNDLLELAR